MSIYCKLKRGKLVIMSHKLNNIKPSFAPYTFSFSLFTVHHQMELILLFAIANINSIYSQQPICGVYIMFIIVIHGKKGKTDFNYTFTASIIHLFQQIELNYLSRREKIRNSDFLTSFFHTKHHYWLMKLE